MGQRDKPHRLSGIIEFDDSYFGGPAAGKKRDRGTEKATVFVALPLDKSGNPCYLKMNVIPDMAIAIQITNLPYKSKNTLWFWQIRIDMK